MIKTNIYARNYTNSKKRINKDIKYSEKMEEIGDDIINNIISYLPYNNRLLINKYNYKIIQKKIIAKNIIVNCFKRYINYKKSLNIFIITYLNRDLIQHDNFLETELNDILNDEFDLETLTLLRNINVYYYFLRIYNTYTLINENTQAINRLENNINETINNIIDNLGGGGDVDNDNDNDNNNVVNDLTYLTDIDNNDNNDNTSNTNNTNNSDNNDNL